MPCPSPHFAPYTRKKDISRTEGIMGETEDASADADSHTDTQRVPPHSAASTTVSTARPVRVNTITPSEWDLMRVIWTLGSAPTREIVERMRQAHGWNESTTKTFLHRLVTNGNLVATREKGHRGFIYAPATGEQAAMDQAVVELFDHLCAMRRGTALQHALVDMPLSLPDIDRLLTILEKKRETAPEQVACNCLGAASGTVSHMSCE